MPAPRKYPPELRERSQRLVGEAMAEDSSLSMNQAVLRIGPMVGVDPDTLRGWVKQAGHRCGAAAGHEHGGDGAGQGTGAGGPRAEAG